MSKAPRRLHTGPSGRAALPSARLNGMVLPLEIVPAGAALARAHRQADDPVFFGPGAGISATWRFDSPTGAFGVLYVGAGLAGALVETLPRNPRRRMVAYGDLVSRALSELRCPRDLRLVDLHGAGLRTLGLDNAISTGPYASCGAWAEALWAHPDAPDGIAWRSRHDPREICYALFERPGLKFTVAPSIALLGQLPALATILGGYGKSIAEPSR